MAFEYRNPTNGDRLAAVELDGDVWLKTTSKGCLVPPDRVEEVVAGIRDAARTAAARQTTPAGPCGCGAPATPDVVHRQGAPCYMDQDGGLQTVELPTVAARQTTGQADTKPAPWIADGRHGPTPAEMRQAIARAIHRYDNQHALSGNDIPSKHHYGEADAVLAVLASIQPDPTTADDPTPLRWGLNDVLWGDDDTVTICLSGPDREPYWLELEPEQRDALRDDLTQPTEAQTALDRVRAVADEWAKTVQRYPDSRLSTETVVFVLRTALAAPAVGQPAEAHDTEARPELRERIAALFRSPAGAERLGDATPGEIADAVLSVLTVEDER